MKQCLDCSAWIKLGKRCKTCAYEAQLNQMRVNNRKRRRFCNPIACGFCSEPILDRGIKGNKRYHDECLIEKNRLKQQDKIVVQGKVTEDRRLEYTSRLSRITKVGFNVRDWQQAPPEKFIRMFACMTR